MSRLQKGRGNMDTPTAGLRLCARGLDRATDASRVLRTRSTPLDQEARRRQVNRESFRNWGCDALPHFNLGHLEGQKQTNFRWTAATARSNSPIRHYQSSWKAICEETRDNFIGQSNQSNGDLETTTITILQAQYWRISLQLSRSSRRVN